MVALFDMTRDEYAHKLWFTESDGRLHDWGDDDRAVGAFQAHIDWIFDHAKKYSLYPKLGERFNVFVGRIVRAQFDDLKSTLEPVEIAMTFHLGHIAKRSAPDWDSNYEERFNKAESV